jgi:YD repeat-containing protein
MTERRRKKTDTDQTSQDDLVESWTYSANYAQVATYTNPAGEVTTNTVDTSGNITQVTHPTITNVTPNVTITESFTYNTYGQVLTHTDGEGNVTKYDYYATGVNAGWLNTVTRDYGTGKLNLITTFEYDNVGNLTSRTDPRSKETTFTVNEFDQVTKITGPGSKNYEIEFDYDAKGLLSEKRVENVDENNTRSSTFPWIATAYTRDVLGNVLTVTEDITSTTDRTITYAYDENGNVETITLPEGNKIRRVWDERDLLYSETRGYDSTDATTSYWTYDKNRNLTKFKNGRGKERESTYDDFDRRTKVEDPLGHYRTNTFDKCGNVTYLKAYKSDDTLMAQRRQYFDEMDRLYKTEDLWDGPGLTQDTVTTKTWFDKCHNVVQVQDDNSKDLYRYFDGANRLYEQKDHLNNRTVLTLDANGNVTQVQEIEVVTGGTETYKTHRYYDEYNRMYEQKVENRNDSNDFHTSKWWYNSLHQVVKFEDAEGNQTTYTNDGLGRMLTKSVDLGSGNAEVLTITWDDNSNQSSLEDDNGSETLYAHDDCDRLKTITYEDAETESFSYDDAQTHGRDVRLRRARSHDERPDVGQRHADDHGGAHV